MQWCDGRISDQAILAATQGVLEAGEAIKKLDPNPVAKEGHRSVITTGDNLSGDILVRCLTSAFPKAPILSEEDSSHPNMLNKDNPEGLFLADLSFVIDPLDGTAPYSSKLANWCVAACILRKGKIIGGAVFAPAINGGMLLVSEKDRETFVVDWITNGGRVRTVAKNGETPPEKCFIVFGVDSTLYSSMTSVLPKIAPNVRCMGMANSGILALSQLACRKIQVVVQTPQKAWDWAGGYRAVKESGQIFRFFRLVPDIDSANREDMLVPIEDYDFDAFRYLPKQHRLGFVAGEPAITERIFNLLPRHGWLRTNPDTAEGKWQ